MKIGNAGGSILANAFDKNLGTGLPCGRVECPICKQVGTREDHRKMMEKSNLQEDHRILEKASTLVSRLVPYMNVP